MNCEIKNKNYCKYSSWIFLLFILLLALNSCQESDPTAPVVEQKQRFQKQVFTDYNLSQQINYGNNYNQNGNIIELYFDFYEPANDQEENRPLIILAPGGAFLFLEFSDMEDLAIELTKYGYSCAVINYRLVSDVFSISTERYLDISVKARSDMKSAIRYFYADASNDNIFRIDTNNIFIGGHSAGAITSMNAAFIDEQDNIFPELENALNNNGGFDGDSGNQNFSSNINGVINLSGAVYDLSIFDNNFNIPIFNMHGKYDSIVPYDEGYISGFGLSLYVYGSKKIYEYTLKNYYQTDLYTYNSGGHTAPVDNIDNTTQEIVRFLFQNLKQGSNAG